MTEIKPSAPPIVNAGLSSATAALDTTGAGDLTSELTNAQSNVTQATAAVSEATAAVAHAQAAVATCMSVVSEAKNALALAMAALAEHAASEPEKYEEKEINGRKVRVINSKWVEWNNQKRSLEGQVQAAEGAVQSAENALENAKSNLESAKSSLEQAKAKLEQAKADFQRAKANIEERRRQLDQMQQNGKLTPSLEQERDQLGYFMSDYHALLRPMIEKQLRAADEALATAEALGIVEDWSVVTQEQLDAIVAHNLDLHNQIATANPDVDAIDAAGFLGDKKTQELLGLHGEGDVLLMAALNDEAWAEASSNQAVQSLELLEKAAAIIPPEIWAQLEGLPEENREAILQHFSTTALTAAGTATTADDVIPAAQIAAAGPAMFEALVMANADELVGLLQELSHGDTSYGHSPEEAIGLLHAILYANGSFLEQGSDFSGYQTDFGNKTQNAIAAFQETVMGIVDPSGKIDTATAEALVGSWAQLSPAEMVNAISGGGLEALAGIAETRPDQLEDRLDSVETGLQWIPAEGLDQLLAGLADNPADPAGVMVLHTLLNQSDLIDPPISLEQGFLSAFQNADGTTDESVKAALEAFQTQNNLEPTGELNEVTAYMLAHGADFGAFNYPLARYGEELGYVTGWPPQELDDGRLLVETSGGQIIIEEITDGLETYQVARVTCGELDPGIPVPDGIDLGPGLFTLRVPPLPSDVAAAHPDVWAQALSGDLSAEELQAVLGPDYGQLLGTTIDGEDESALFLQERLVELGFLQPHMLIHQDDTRYETYRMNQTTEALFAFQAYYGLDVSKDIDDQTALLLASPPERATTYFEGAYLVHQEELGYPLSDPEPLEDGRTVQHFQNGYVIYNGEMDADGNLTDFSNPGAFEIWAAGPGGAVQFVDSFQAMSLKAAGALEWSQTQMAGGEYVNSHTGESQGTDVDAWYDWCLAFVATAFDREVPELAARTAYLASVKFENAGKLVAPEEGEVPQIPLGAPVFFDKTPSNPSGHIGICVGYAETGWPIIRGTGIRRDQGIFEQPLNELEGVRYVGDYLGYGEID